MLTVEGLECAYGEALVLRGVSLRLAPGQVLGLLGRNGAGKTTTLRAIMGLLRPRAGRIVLDGRDLGALRPYEIPRLGVAYVPQGRGLFPFLTVEENLRMGLLVRDGDRRRLEEIFELFPALRERLRQRAGTLSGGEQQMVATARALAADPRYLLMDEPLEGLMPLLVEALLGVIGQLRARGVGVLLVEQRIEAALRAADEVALMEVGRIRYQGTAAELANHPDVLQTYLGVRRDRRVGG
ncbi:MAG: ABC transporter ATP-binding protein [Armatimonadota bacterium]|nr:ABC transporter ATP-binding protein [Armatimonadota bacterium]MDR7497839.1 ABC transporter ATP-binding protein [Armatimonadota bacterium]MDR7512388.1 ABC transporter ATP-binding protein [Armatimonadota bacterium]